MNVFKYILVEGNTVRFYTDTTSLTKKDWIEQRKETEESLNPSATFIPLDNQ